MSKKIVKKELTLQQEKFCQTYLSKDFFGNGVRSYIEAFDIDINKKGAYDVARSGASDLLAKPYIFERINFLLEEGGFNDSHIDKQLLFIINQHADLSSKVAGIREYNKLKQRIIAKTELSGKIETSGTVIILPAKNGGK